MQCPLQSVYQRQLHHKARRGTAQANTRGTNTHARSDTVNKWVNEITSQQQDNNTAAQNKRGQMQYIKNGTFIYNIYLCSIYKL